VPSLWPCPTTGRRSCFSSAFRTTILLLGLGHSRRLFDSAAKVNNLDERGPDNADEQQEARNGVGLPVKAGKLKDTRPLL